MNNQLFVDIKQNRDLKIFNDKLLFNNKEIRVYGGYENPWFCGKDIAKILEYKETDKAIKVHVSFKNKMPLDDLMNNIRPDESSGLTNNEKHTFYINEPGVYQLIFKSRTKEAEKFQDWIFEEVLPSIRKKGYYVPENLNNKQLIELQKQLLLKDKTIESQILLLKEKEEKFKALIKQKEFELNQTKQEMDWLHIKSKSQVSFLKRPYKTDYNYRGSNKSESNAFINKFGSTNDANNRERDLGTSSAPANSFKMEEVYPIHSGLGRKTESYIQKILEPFHITDPDIKGSNEHYMIHNKVLKYVCDTLIYTQNKVVDKLNDYIQLLEDNYYNFDIVNNLLDTINFEGEKKSTTIIKKECIECKASLSIDNFYFVDEINNYNPKCINCINGQSIRIKKEIELNPLNGKSFCGECREVYTDNLFFKTKNNELWKQCIPCIIKKEGRPVKQCNSCYEAKRFSLYSKDKYSPDGYKSQCLDCVNKARQIKASIRVYVECQFCKQKVLHTNLGGHHKSNKCKIIQNRIKNGEEQIVKEEIEMKENIIIVDQPKKTCSECGKNKTISSNFYIKDKNVGTYRSKCIQCYNIKAKEMSKKIKDNPMCGKKECNLCNQIINEKLFFTNYETCILCLEGKNGFKSKECSYCETVKNINEFGNDKSKTDGKSTQCKICRTEKERMRRLKIIPKDIKEI
jgi:prophage antirepressor-like protein